MEYEYTGQNRLFSFALKSYRKTISRDVYTAQTHTQHTHTPHVARSTMHWDHA